MRIYRMSVDELEAAGRDLGELVDVVRADHPEAALVLLDCMELVCRELLVHTVGGDRELAKRIFNKAHGAH